MNNHAKSSHRPSRPHRLVLAAAVIAGASIASPAAFAEDLVGVYELAEQKDPQFKSSEANYAAVQEAKPQARAALMLPTLSASGNTTYNEEDVTTDGGAIGGDGLFRFNSRGYSLNLTQPVYHYDRFMVYEQADARIRQARLQVDAARQDLVVRVAERYFNVLAAIDSTEFAKAEREALARQLDQTQQRFDVGLIAITDVQEAKAGHDLAVAQEIEANNALDDAREALREFTGEYHQQLAGLSEKLPLVTPQPADVDQWTDTASKQNLQVSAAQAATEVAAQEIKVQYAGHIPSLDIVGSHGTAISGGRFGATDIEASAIGVQLNVPIYQGGVVQSRTREATHRHEEALQQLERARRAAVRTAREGYTGVIAGISRIKALEQAVVSTQTALEATRAGYEVGTRTAVDVVTQEREYYRSKRDLARARYDYILDTLRLKQAAGTLWPQELTQINRWMSN
jgi:outer membrane protein